MAALLMLSPFLLMAISFNQVALCTYPAYHVRTLPVVYLPCISCAHSACCVPTLPCPAYWIALRQYFRDTYHVEGHEGVDDEVDKSDNSDFGNDELF